MVVYNFNSSFNEFMLMSLKIIKIKILEKKENLFSFLKIYRFEAYDDNEANERFLGRHHFAYIVSKYY